MSRVAAVVTAAALTVGLAACSGGSSNGPSPAPTGSASATTSASTACAGGTPTYKSPPPTLPVNSVPLTTSAPPWAPPLLTAPEQTAAYVVAAGLPCSEEMLQVHYHAHLDINVNGKAVVVPQYLGFVAQGDKVAGLAPLHTHDNTGIIHIENSVPADFLLGQLFIEWGVRFTPRCLGPYCAGHGKELALYVNGKRYSGDPTKLVLAKHQEIVIEYGTTGKLPPPPSSYAFPAGL